MTLHGRKSSGNCFGKLLTVLIKGRTFPIIWIWAIKALNNRFPKQSVTQVGSPNDERLVEEKLGNSETSHRYESTATIRFGSKQ